MNDIMEIDRSLEGSGLLEKYQWNNRKLSKITKW